MEFGAEINPIALGLFIGAIACYLLTMIFMKNRAIAVAGAWLATGCVAGGVYFQTIEWWPVVVLGAVLAVCITFSAARSGKKTKDK